MLKYPRADSLTIIKDLVYLMDKGIVNKLSDISLVFPKWKRTRQYHYWSAIRDLSLAYIEEGNIRVTDLGKDLSSIITFSNCNSSTLLNDSEIRFIKNLLLSYQPMRTFLSYFIDKKDFFNYSQLIDNGTSIAILRDPLVDNTVKLLSGYGIYHSINHSAAYAYRWTLKLWLKHLGIIDEIWLSKRLLERQPFRGLEFQNRTLYPIKTDLSKLTPFQLRRMLDKSIALFEKKYIFVPLLTYVFCLKYFISISDFYKMLIDIYRSDPYHYYLEIGSLRTYDESFKNISHYETFPKVDGLPRSHLIVRS